MSGKEIYLPTIFFIKQENPAVSTGRLLSPALLPTVLTPTRPRCSNSLSRQTQSAKSFTSCTLTEKTVTATIYTHIHNKVYSEHIC